LSEKCNQAFSVILGFSYLNSISARSFD
jgi:hypothetical protein